MENLSTLKKLTSLSVGETRVTDRGIKLLAAFPLESLEISGTVVSDLGVSHLADHASLKSLYACDTRIGNSGLRLLTTIPNLEFLDLARTKVTESGLLELKPSHTTKAIFVHGNGFSPERVEEFNRSVGGRPAIIDD